MLLLLLLSLARTHARNVAPAHSLVVRNAHARRRDEPEGPFTVVAVSFVVVVVDIRRGRTAKAAASDALSPDEDLNLDPKVYLSKRAPENRYTTQPRRFFARSTQNETAVYRNEVNSSQFRKIFPSLPHFCTLEFEKIIIKLFDRACRLERVGFPDSIPPL